LIEPRKLMFMICVARARGREAPRPPPRLRRGDGPGLPIQRFGERDPPTAGPTEVIVGCMLPRGSRRRPPLWRSAAGRRWREARRPRSRAPAGGSFGGERAAHQLRTAVRLGLQGPQRPHPRGAARRGRQPRRAVVLGRRIRAQLVLERHARRRSREELLAYLRECLAACTGSQHDAFFPSGENPESSYFIQLRGGHVMFCVTW